MCRNEFVFMRENDSDSDSVGGLVQDVETSNFKRNEASCSDLPSAQSVTQDAIPTTTSSSAEVPGRMSGPPVRSRIKKNISKASNKMSSR